MVKKLVNLDSYALYYQNSNNTYQQIVIDSSQISWPIDREAFSNTPEIAKQGRNITDRIS